eukprot:scaffold3015_cov122-Cylindrotheca_fusiformis.AAC.16
MKFLCLLSPTKTLAEKSCKEYSKNSNSLSSSSTSSIIVDSLLSHPRSILLQRVQELNKSELKSIMKLSDNLAELNYQRYQEFQKQPQYPAGWLFDGPSFQKLNIYDFNQEQLNRLNSCLIILSGLYGFLRPSDPMQPYRLEMGTKLSVPIPNGDDGTTTTTTTVNNLYSFWNHYDLTEKVSALAEKDGGRCILNCASLEYSKVLNLDQMRNKNNLQVLDVVFQAAANGRMASVHAKQARGMFVRFVAKANPTSLKELEQFTGDGHYTFVHTDKTNQLIFERHDTALGDGDETLWNGNVGISSSSSSSSSGEVSNKASSSKTKKKKMAEITKEKKKDDVASGKKRTVVDKQDKDGNTITSENKRPRRRSTRNSR